ncbi:filamentous hemagglutinin N-terminal domain-containing protein [Gloeothece verrucosa]|nr:filamentous hemagglutinin N-terminal domain-containing protein [Gloeothece verrucosa]
MVAAISLCCLNVYSSRCNGQISSDPSVGTQVTSTDNLHFTITGGRQAGGNLFHSLREFSVPNGGEAFFDNLPEVQNIITRVTGGSMSNINGIIRANGNANLFLLNPSGILFGPNASLNLGGSLIATTANQIKFADGTFYSAVDSPSQPLLTLSVPIGLQFGNNPAAIINQSRVDNSAGLGVGLEVAYGKTLALVGGNIFLTGGILSAPGGRIELTSVGNNSLVSLNPIEQGWSLGIEGVQAFQDIQLSQEARVRTTASEGQTSGDILLQGRQIVVTGGSILVSFNQGINQGGDIVIKASESLKVSDFSNINTNTFSTGASGDITIDTKQLIVRDNSFIDASNQGNGQGGNLSVNASESVEVGGDREGISVLTTQTANGSTNAGTLKVTTEKLILRDGGRIDSSTKFSSGNGGTVRIDASKSIEIRGQTLENQVISPSGIFATTTEQGTRGNGGNLIINTEQLVVRDGGTISVAAVKGSIGQAGSLDINASKSILIDNKGSTILGTTESPNPAGNLSINTPQLLINNGGEISVSSMGKGTAGNLLINTENLLLNNGGSIKAETIGEQGNINLNVQALLSLRNNSQISSTAKGSGDGGNININARLILAVPNENSDITANAFEGKGGNITITTEGIYGIEPRASLTGLSDINASSQLGISGVVQINQRDFDPQDKLSENPNPPETPQLLQGCQFGSAETSSRFVITGRGGLASDPFETLSNNEIWEDIQPPQDLHQTPVAAQNSTPTSDKVVEAKGWLIDSQGKVTLISQPAKVITRRCDISGS